MASTGGKGRAHPRSRPDGIFSRFGAARFAADVIGGASARVRVDSRAHRIVTPICRGGAKRKSADSARRRYGTQGVFLACGCPHGLISAKWKFLLSGYRSGRGGGTRGGGHVSF